MARGEAISDLYLRLGLQYDELQSDFVQAESTIQTNMARLSRENTTIRLQAQVELSGLDEATDAAQIFNIRTQALNRQIANQRDRVNMANAQLRNMATAHGENSDQAQRARIALERERLALADLERELRNLNETQEETNSGTGGFLENLQGMAEKAAPVVAGITAIAGALQMAADYSAELIEKFRELQKQSYDLNMPFGRTKDFLRQLRLGGGDYGDFEGYIRGITGAYVTGEVDDPEFIALSRYGAQITDATGRLKDFKDITEEVYQAYKRAKAEGNEIEFLQLTGGESGVRDAKQFFDRYEESLADKAKIFDSGINPDELHKSERALNLLTEQVGEFKDALTDVITPATQAALDDLFEVFHDGTKFVAENKDELQRWGTIAAEALSNFSGNALLSNLQNVFNGFSKITEQFKDVKLDFGDAGQNAQYENFLQSINDLNQNTLRNYFRDWAYDEIIGRATASQKVFNATLKDTGTAYADMSKKIAQAISQGEQLSQYGQQRINQFRDELEDLRIELDFGDDEYGKAKAQLDLWLQRELTDKTYVSRGEENAIRELYAAKNEQIEREQAEKIENIRKESLDRANEYLRDSADIEFALTHDAFEKQLYDIERWKEAQLEKADTAEEVAGIISDAAMKEADAFEKEMDRIKGKIESAQDRLARLTLSQYDNDVRNAEKQYQADIESGVPKQLADAIYQATMQQIIKRSRDDKSGKYRANPLGNRYDTSQLLNFTGAVDGSVKSLIDMDAELLANKQMIAKATRAGEEFDRVINQAGVSATSQQDILDKVNSGTSSAAEKFQQSLQGVGDVSNDLQSQLSSTADGVKDLADSAINGGKNIVSATDTVQRAFDNLNAMGKLQSEENFEQLEKPDRRRSGFDIIYGDDDLYSHDYKQNGMTVLYGDDDSESILDLDALNGSAQNAALSLDELTNATVNFTPEIAQSALSESINRVVDAQDYLAKSITDSADTLPIKDATNSIAEAMQASAEKISAAGNIQNVPIPAQTQDVDVVGTALKLGQTGANAAALYGSATMNPYLAIGGGGASVILELIDTIRDSGIVEKLQNIQTPQPVSDYATPTYPEIDSSTQNALGEITQELAKLTGDVSNILSDVSQKNSTPPNITVSPNINIDLGGAYVFDNAMKQQLTDDITREVADGVRSAVENATSQANYSYGN